MKGWKTWTGVVGLVIVAVATNYLGVDMAEAQTNADKVVNLIEAGAQAMVVIGLGHKLEK
jgi:anti-sigma-K factor RskA